jgi:hypothetical protein
MAKNGNDATPGPGHNSTLTDEERRALFLHHKKHYEAADAIVDKAKAERTAVANLAKSDLGKGALGEIKSMIALSDEKTLKAMLERTLRLARWVGMPVGHQMQMFDVMPVDDKAHEDGKTDGMRGEACNPPHHLPPTAHQRWISGWHEGQALLASAFKKKRDQQVEANQPPPADSEAKTEAVAH